MGLPDFFQHKPYKCREVTRALVNLGFEEQPGKGTSHSQWKKHTPDGRLLKVTLDCHGGEVKAKDVKSIISQAGVSKAEFKAAMDK